MGDKGGKKNKAKNNKQAQLKKDSKQEAAKKNFYKQTGQDKPEALR